MGEDEAIRAAVNTVQGSAAYYITENQQSFALLSSAQTKRDYVSNTPLTMR